jgi:hypothetical protein
MQTIASTIEAPVMLTLRITATSSLGTTADPEFR